MALNAAAGVGLDAETRNFLVVSAANTSKIGAFDVAGSDTSAAYGLAHAPGLAPTAPFQRASARAADRHLAFRRAESRDLATLVRSPRRRLLQSQPLVLGDTLKLWVIKEFLEDDFDEVQVTAEVAVVGQHCLIALDQAATQSASRRQALRLRAQEVAEAFDRTIYPTTTRIFGSEPKPGVDGDERVMILFSPAVGNYGKDTTLGYFSQRDAFAPDPRAGGKLARSNARELLYVSSQILLQGGPQDYLGTIAHEFQHMINFNQKVLLGKQRTSEDLWIDEGMAMYAIEANGYGLKAGGTVLANHVKQFQKEPDAYSLSDWDGNPQGIGYGPVYLLVVYLADHFGEDLIKAIVTSPKVGVGNVSDMLQKRGANLAGVIHDWALANLLDGDESVSDPRYQYQSLAMRGANGMTNLSGFTTSTIRLPTRLRVSGRPLNVRYYRLEDGVLAPRFTITGASGASVQPWPRLVLP
ncbi:MAG: hypothetical protein VKP62_13780 [Candidatus Sericytochromatia bacterium]|nr:hypothetical protein [Candidatus Sericytochromatia bacterium]